MKKITFSLVLSILALIITSCDKDDFDSNPNTDPNLSTNDLIFQSENFGDLTTSNFFGIIKDENGLFLENVQISIGNAITATDRNGIFTLNNAEVFENFAYVKAFKPGYMSGSRVVIPKEEGSNRIDIVLYKDEPVAVINSDDNAILNIVGGLKLNFTGTQFVKDDGSPYNGPIEVNADYLRPNSLDTFTNMPGSLFAQTANNEAVNLQTYGMVSVDLFSPCGETLEIADESSVTIEYPINFDQIDIGPETITLWYFDENVGYWKEDGQAIRAENTYIAEVSHFTWWNIDVPFELVNLCFSLNSVDQNGSSPYFVAITNDSNQLIYSGIILTDNDAECGFIPANEDLTISVYSNSDTCSFQLVYQETIGSFSSDSEITVSISEESTISNAFITGTVTNCNGMPLSNGYIYVDENNIFSISDGIIDIAISYCSETTTTLQIYDNDSGQWTIVYDLLLNGNTVDIGTVSTCESSGGIYNGNVVLTTQQQVEDFGNFGYDTVNGNIRIGDFEIDSDIDDLTSLASLENVMGSLVIFNNSNLVSFVGLNNLSSVQSLSIQGNTSLNSIGALSNLNEVGEINIAGNQILSSLEGLEGVSSTNSITLFSNPFLTSLNGLNSLTAATDVTLGNLSSLNSISALGNLSSADRVQLYNLPELNTLEPLSQLTELLFLRITRVNGLTDLSAFSNLTSINFLNLAGNESLTSLDGLENLIYSEWILIGIDLEFDIFVDAPNNNLTDYCALENLFINGTYIENPTNPNFPTNGVTIVDNAYNPSVQDIINGNCSQ